MRTIAGPYDGTAAGLAKGSKSNPDVFAAVQRYIVTGGSSQNRVGAVRSLAVAASRPIPFSWASVPLHAAGDFCIKKGARPNIVRSRITRAETATIVDMHSKRRVQISFAKGQDSIPWPADLDIDPRVTYTVVTPGPVTREVRMRIIEPLPAREDTLQVLHGQRCSSQFRAYLRELQNSSN